MSEGDPRIDELARHGRAYGELGLAIAFTKGITGEAAKQVVSRGWEKTRPLPNADFGEAQLVERGLRRNPAVVLGPSGLIAIDIDGREGLALLRKYVPEALPHTVTVKTGTDSGYHIWFRRLAGCGTVYIELGPETKAAPRGIKLKTGQYLVAPPAQHPSGTPYFFYPGRAPWEIPIAPLPGWILDRFVQAERAGRRDVVTIAGPVAEGGRHNHLVSLGGAMIRRGASLEAIEAALLAQNKTVCQPPMAGDEVLALARDLHDRYAAVEQPEAAA